MLVQRFIEALPEPVRSRVAAEAFDGEQLRQLVERARAAHPRFAPQVSAEAFAASLALRVRAALTVSDALKLLHVEDLFLAHAALTNEPEAQAQLRLVLEREVQQAVRNQAGAASLVDEVKQQLFSKLLVGDGRAPKLAEYSGRGPIGAWLRASALGVALNLRRAQGPVVAADDHDFDERAGEDLRIAADDPELEYMRALCRSEFNAAFTQALATLEPKERNLIRLRFLDGLSLAELATYHRVHRATAVRWLSELSTRLFDETRRSLRDNLALEQPEVDSLLRAARSRIDFSLGGMLRQASLG